jgi:hypothetical protein
VISAQPLQERRRAWIEDPAAVDFLRAVSSGAGVGDLERARDAARQSHNLAVRAAILTLCDLRETGWGVAHSEAHGFDLSPPAGGGDVLAEKARLRSEMGVARDAQLRTSAVQAFLTKMEAPRWHRGGWRSIYSLMRDGRQLAGLLAARAGNLDGAILPYVQVVDAGARCEWTGLPLQSVWRYFRHTWAMPYRSVPGRGVAVLVRDAADVHHAIIGIGMIASAASQSAVRDEWIGWSPEAVLAEVESSPAHDRARWVARTLSAELAGVFVADLLEDGVLTPADLVRADPASRARLLAEAGRRWSEHARFADAPALRQRPADFDAEGDPSAWSDRAREPLFRAKRALALADLYRAREVVRRQMPEATAANLSRMAATADGRRTLQLLARRSKASRLGSGLAEIVVCGAVSPYRELLGGKLVAALISATARDTFEARYGSTAGLISSSIAGRPMVRDGGLALLTTTSLFPRGVSQYNRLKVPAADVEAQDLEFKRIGETAGFGSAHLGDDTTAALSAYLSEQHWGRRYHSLFGEGVNPKLRKVRDALDLLGFASDVVLRHGTGRILYVVPVAANVRRYLQGLDDVAAPGPCFTVADVSAWWTERWLAQRVRQGAPLAAAAAHSLARPVRHGARVVRPLDVDENEDG